jgi:N-acetylmuramoyl-L-alanine amidase/FlgD Ig-like domain
MAAWWAALFPVAGDGRASSAPVSLVASGGSVVTAARTTMAPAARVPPTISGDVFIDLDKVVPPDAVVFARDDRVRTRSATRTSSVRACPGFWFTTLGVVWDQYGEGTLRARVQWADDRGSVLGRATLADAGDEGPDPGMPDGDRDRRGTDALWTGGGRCADVVLELPAGVTVSHLHVAFANTSGSSAGPGTGPPDVPSVETTYRTGGAGVSMPPMVTRAQWDAAMNTFDTGSPGCSAPYYSPQVKVAYVHHTSGSNSYSASQADDVVRGINWFHTQERGYCDIAYNFLVDRFGRIYVGRAGGVDQPVTPGSQAGFNPYTFSVAVMGNFVSTRPSPAAVASLERVLAWRLDVAHVPAQGTATLVSQGYDTDRYPPGTAVTMHTIEGHRRTSYTDCPGRIEAMLPRIRSDVAAIGGAKILRPAQSAQSVTPGSGTVRFTAKANRTLTWTVTIERQDGTVVRRLTVSGPSSALSARWDGTDRFGREARPGTYRVVIAGQATNGDRARPAELPIDVPGPLEGPRPVPTGTVRVPSGFGALRGVAATSASDVWAVGSLSRIGAQKPLVRHLDGSSWHRVAAPNPGFHGSALNAVDALSGSDAWAGGLSCLDADCGPYGGYGSRTLLVHWNGGRWEAVPTPSPGTAVNEIRAVDARAPDDVWAVGLWSDRGRWLRHGLVLHWDGASWSQARIPYLSGEVHLEGVSASAADDAWAVGERCPGPCSGLAHSSAVILHWDGTRWMAVAPPRLSADRSGLDGVLALDHRHAWAVGGRSKNRVAPTHPLFERWDGTSWRLGRAPLAGKSTHWFFVTRVPGAGPWAFGSFVPTTDYRPLAERRRSDGSWARAAVPSPDVHLAYLRSGAVVSWRNAWAVGPSSAGPYAVHWNGSSWITARTG